MKSSLQIEQVDAPDLTRKKFRSSFFSDSRPVIIKGFANLFPAGKLWTFDYLDEKIGNHIIGVIDNSKKRNTAITSPDLRMKFSEFSAIIRRDEETPLRIFAFNMFREFPGLKKEFPTPEIVRGVLGSLGLVFFGGKNTTVRFHYDIDCSGVLMTQVIGRKRVKLIPPSYDSLLYKVPFTSFSLIDFENLDYEKFPGLKFIDSYDFILQPGDALFMPTRFWHFNTYLEGGMAVSYRVLANKASDLYTGIMNTTIRLIFDKSMNAMMGDRWMKEKKLRAFANANKAIAKAKNTLDFL